MNYIYNIILDIESSKVNLQRLKSEIENSSISSNLDRIDGNIVEIDIYFTNPLSANEKTLLDGIVESHSGDPIPEESVPQQVSIAQTKPFSDAQGFRARFQGFSGTVTAGEEGYVDYIIEEERFINGVRILLKNHMFGDSLRLQVVDTNFTYAGDLYPSTPAEAGVPVPEETPWSAVMPDGVLLDEFGSSWYVADDIQCQPDVITPYPARLLTGMTLRVLYTSTGDTNVNININAYLHWKAE